MPRCLWKQRPDSNDFPNAESYLALLFSSRQATGMVRKLRKAKTVTHPAKDIFRASALRLLPGDDPHVARDLGKITKGKKLSPILLVRGDATRGLPLIIADGYHRLCAAYHHDYDDAVLCLIVARPKGSANLSWPSLLGPSRPQMPALVPWMAHIQWAMTKGAIHFLKLVIAARHETMAG